jgi:hypothetical protein
MPRLKDLAVVRVRGAKGEVVGREKVTTAVLLASMKSGKK